MAFPTTPVLDTFTGTNGTDLPVYSSNWKATATGANPLEIQGNAATGSAASNNAQAWDTLFGANSEVYVTFSTLPGAADIVLLFARARPVSSLATLDGYCLRYSNNIVNLQRMDNGVQTTLGANISQTLSAGDSLGLEIVGSTLKAYYKASGGSWVQIGTERLDTTYTHSGFIGLFSSGTTVRLDNFGGGSVEGYAPVIFAAQNFSGSGATALESGDTNWEKLSNGTIYMDGTTSSGGTDVLHYDFKNKLPVADCVVFVDLFTTSATNHLPGPAARCNKQATKNYAIFAFWDGDTSLWNLRQITNDFSQTLGTSASFPPTTTRKVELHCVGSLVYLLVDGNEVISATTTILDAGYVGLRSIAADVGALIDNFKAIYDGPLQPTLSINEGTSVGTLSITEAGVADTYQWQSAPITDLYSKVPGTWSDIGSATSKTYNTPALTSADEGKWFKCISETIHGIKYSEPIRTFLKSASTTGIGSLLKSAWAFKRDNTISTGASWLRNTVAPEFRSGDIKDAVFGDWWWPATTVAATIKIRIGSVFVDCPVYHHNGTSFESVLAVKTRQSGAWV